MKPQLTAKDLDAYWIPFTANLSFKKKPGMVSMASGAYLKDAEGRRISDGLSALWCSRQFDFLSYTFRVRRPKNRGERFRHLQSRR